MGFGPYVESQPHFRGFLDPRKDMNNGGSVFCAFLGVWGVGDCFGGLVATAAGGEFPLPRTKLEPLIP